MAWILHVPLTVSASHNVRPWFIPYAAVGYGTYWVIGYGDPTPGVSYAGRSYTGDGLLMLHAGVELTRATGRALLSRVQRRLAGGQRPGRLLRLRHQPLLLDRVSYRPRQPLRSVADPGAAPAP